MDVLENLRRIGSGDLPAWAMGGVGLILLWIAVKGARRLLRAAFVLLALALLAGALWWHFRGPKNLEKTIKHEVTRQLDSL